MEDLKVPLRLIIATRCCQVPGVDGRVTWPPTIMLLWPELMDEVLVDVAMTGCSICTGG